MFDLNTYGAARVPSGKRSIGRRALLLAMLLAGAGLQTSRAEEPFRVGVMSGDGELLVEQVAIQAKALGLPLKVIAFSDYLLPNEALNHGELDANAFQHQPYLDNQIKTRGYHIVPVGWTVVAPIGLEGKDSQYALVFTTRAKDKDDARVAKLIEVYRSPEVKQFILDKFAGSIIPTW